MAQTKAATMADGEGRHMRSESIGELVAVTPSNLRRSVPGSRPSPTPTLIRSRSSSFRRMVPSVRSLALSRDCSRQLARSCEAWCRRRLTRGHRPPQLSRHLFTSIGAWKLGACVLPLRWDMPDWERASVLEVAKPTLVVGYWNGIDQPVLTAADLRAADHLSSDPLPDRTPNPAMAIASGGCPGRPKVIITPGSGLSPGPQTAANSDDQRNRRVHALPSRQLHLIPSPMYHAAGFRGSHNALLSDQPVVIMERFEPDRAVELIERHRVNVVNMVPTMLMRIARLPDIAHRDLSSIDSVMAGSAACPEWVVRAWCDLVGPDHFFISYGASEFTGLTLTRGDEWMMHPGTVGRGVGTAIRILGEDDEPAPVGVIGEIYMRPDVDIGPTYQYRGADPAKTTADGFVSVGDLGRPTPTASSISPTDVPT